MIDERKIKSRCCRQVYFCRPFRYTSAVRRVVGCMMPRGYRRSVPMMHARCDRQPNCSLHHQSPVSAAVISPATLDAFLATLASALIPSKYVCQISRGAFSDVLSQSSGVDAGATMPGGMHFWINHRTEHDCSRTPSCVQHDHSCTPHQQSTGALFPAETRPTLVRRLLNTIK